MDRLREPTRRGSLSGGVQISSLRRPRSGNFKDSTAADEDEPMEDFHSARLRERPRKDGSFLVASRHKRTRHAPGELHSRNEAVEEAQGDESGASDEDDEVPISPNLLPRKPSKLRFHGKVPPEEGNAVEIPTVPRKARTAVSKRSYESLRGDSRSQQFAPQSSTLVDPLHTPSGPALKHVKRMKQNGSKVKVARHHKVSASISISEQEVEVAEALFDLARMVSNMGSPLCNNDTQDVKMENDETKGTAWLNTRESTPIRQQDSISTPPSSHSAVSSPGRGPDPVSTLYIPASEAPLRKISLSKLKIEDGVRSQSKNDVHARVKSVVDNTGQSNGLKSASLKDKGLPGPITHPITAGPFLPGPNQFSQPSNINVSAIDDKTRISIDGALGSNTPSKSGSNFLEQKQECGRKKETADACDISALSKEIKLEASYSCKQEMDLMATLSAYANGGIETNANIADPNKVFQGKDLVSLVNIAQRDNRPPADACTVKEEGMSSVTETEAWKNPQLSEDIKEGNCKDNELAQQAVKQEFLSTAKHSKPDLMNQQRADGSGGWLGGLPHMGYYPSAAAAAVAAAAVAASWPANSPVIGSVSTDEKGHLGLQVPPFTFPSARPLCKRCATHVYIAHFIDTQMQMQRHPIWAAAYGMSAAGGLYSMKPYNANASLASNALFGGGMSGLTGLSINNSPASRDFISDSTLQDDKSSTQGQMEKSKSLNTDGVDRTGASQSLHARSQDKVRLMQAGLGPMFGYPFVGSCSVSAEAGGNYVSDKGSSAAGPTAAVVSVGVSTSSNTDSVNVAAAQAQYLQAIIQQAGFPFSFSPGHLMPSTVGHTTQQQATHFYGNAFYNAPFVQQASVTGRTVPRITSSQGQNTGLHQDARVSRLMSQQHQQHQQHLSCASSQTYQQIASQQVQHFGDRGLNLGGEVVSSAESLFPGHQTNMQSRETSSLHASNVASSTCLQSSGVPVLPTSVSPPAKQVANMKLPLVQSVQSGGQGEAQQSYQHFIPQHRSMAAKNMDFQPATGLSSVPSGAASKNMIGPGPLGLASVADVMAPRGHTVLQTIADSQLSYNAYQEQSLQQNYGKYLTNVSLEGSRVSAEISDEKRTTVKQAAPSCTSRMDTESEGSLRDSAGNKNVLTSMHMHQNLPGVTLNFMTSPANNLGSRQGASLSLAPISVGSITDAVLSSKPVVVGRASTVSNTVATSHELNKTPSNVSFHVSSVSGQPGMRQEQAPSQYSSQTKPTSRVPVGTTCVSTGPSQLFPGSYAGVPNTKQAAYYAQNQQPSLSSMQSRYPPTVSGSSSVSASPSTSISMSNSTAVVKSSSPATKASISSSQKHAPPVAVGKKPDVPLTHSPGQVAGLHSVTVNLGQQQQQQAQHQQIQHVMKQQQHWQQQQQKQHLYLHQERLQQGPLSMHHQVHVAGVPPTVTVQYHQASGTSPTGQAGVQKQSAQSQQMNQRLYLDQHFHQQQLQQQPQLMEPQQSARPSIQQHSTQHPVIVASNRSMQQPSESQHQQVVKHSTPATYQQSFPLLASFGTSSGMVVPHASTSISMGNGSAGRPTSSDGALMQVTSPKASPSMKPPGGTGVSGSGSNLQRSDSGISNVQGMGVKVADTKLQPQLSSNISYLPYLQSATFSSSVATVGKSHGASFMPPQSGATVKVTREPLAGAAREENNGNMQQLGNERACPLPSVTLSTSGNPHSSTVSATANVKSSIPQINMDARVVPRATPLVVLHGLSGSHVATASSQSSQTCTVMSASITADSVSTTG